VYLSVNLAKSLKTLHYAELLVACSSIDAVSGSISMAFSYKDVLAARKVVFLGFQAQLLAFGVLGAALSRLQKYPVAACAAHIRHPVFDHDYPALMWLYYTVRLLLASVPAPIAYRFSIRLNTMEHGQRLGPDVMEARTWASLPATLFTNYIYFFGIFLLHGTAVVFFIPKTVTKKESWDALWTEWGQSAAFIVAVFAIIHVVYSIWKLWRGLRKEASGDETKPPPKLHAPDELLFNEKPLHTYEELQANMTEQERRHLWEELISAFKEKNTVWVNDCLDRGPPMDWKDSQNETVLHMAARLGDTAILDRIFLPDRPFSLLEKSNANETPLHVAVKVNTVAAIGYLLAEMNKNFYSLSEIATKEAVVTCFDMAVTDHKEAALERLTSWPDWRNLPIGGKLALPYFTSRLWKVGYEPVGYNPYVKATKELLESRDKMLRVLIERSEMSRTERLEFIGSNISVVKSSALGKFMLEQIPGPVSSSFDDITEGSNLVIKHALRLGLAQTLYSKGTDRHMVLIVAAYNGHNEVVQDLLNSSSPIPDQVLDCAFLSETLDDDTRNALSSKGARDWSKFLVALRRNFGDELTEVLEREDDETRARMLRAKNEDGLSAVSLVVHGHTHLTKSQIPERLELLFEYKASATDVDFKGNTALLLAVDERQPATVITQLLSRMDIEHINLPNKRGKTVYDLIWQPSMIGYQYCVDLVDAILDCEADLYISDVNGRIGIQLLEKSVEKMTENVEESGPWNSGLITRSELEENTRQVVELVKIDKAVEEEIARRNPGADP
jgi:ankyrin repeat protein